MTQIFHNIPIEELSRQYKLVVSGHKWENLEYNWQHKHLAQIKTNQFEIIRNTRNNYLECSNTFLLVCVFNSCSYSISHKYCKECNSGVKGRIEQEIYCIEEPIGT